MAAWARLRPMERTPWPPNPAKTALMSIPVSRRVLEYPEGVCLDHLLVHPLPRFHHPHLPVDGAGRQYLHHGVAEVIHLNAEGLLNGLLGLPDACRRSDGSALNIDD